MIKSSQFKKFDYGKEDNLKLYGTKVAPFYNLNKIQEEVAIFVGSYDRLGTVKDAKDFNNN